MVKRLAFWSAENVGSAPLLDSEKIVPSKTFSLPSLKSYVIF